MKTWMHLSPRAMCWVFVAVMTVGAAVACADSDVVVMNPVPSQRSLSEAEVLSHTPVVNPLAEPDTSTVMPDTEAGPFPSGAMSQDGIVGDVGPRAFGSFGVPYTTTRVQEGDQNAAGTTSANHLSTTYPYLAVGKLTFSAGYCSASLIRKSVIVTAAHCIQGFGTGDTIFLDFQFRPGHYGAAGATAAQIAPYGTWNWVYLVRPSSWADGSDIGTGAARDNDLAVIALGKNAQGQFIGELTGWLAYGWNNYSFVTSHKTGDQHTAAVSTLGYPRLMDDGAIMQRTDGPAYTTTLGGAGQIWQGSNFTGGASGSPWIVNFRSRPATLSGGAIEGDASVVAVIGVTSWGSSNPNVAKDNWSSQFRQNTRYPNASYGVYGAGNIASLLHTLCSAAAPGGGTLASQGYCD
jgi:Trypsin